MELEGKGKENKKQAENKVNSILNRLWHDWSVWVKYRSNHSSLHVGNAKNPKRNLHVVRLFLVYICGRNNIGHWFMALRHENHAFLFPPCLAFFFFFPLKIILRTWPFFNNNALNLLEKFRSWRFGSKMYSIQKGWMSLCQMEMRFEDWTEHPFPSSNQRERQCLSSLRFHLSSQ